MYDFAVDIKPGVAFLKISLQLLFQCTSFGHADGTEHREACAGGVGEHALNNVLRRVLLHLLSADGAVGPTDAGIQQAQVFVDLGAGAYGGAWVVRVHLLFDGDGGREARDAFHVGLVESAHELPRI